MGIVVKKTPHICACFGKKEYICGINSFLSYYHNQKQNIMNKDYKKLGKYIVVLLILLTALIIVNNDMLPPVPVYDDDYSLYGDEEENNDKQQYEEWESEEPPSSPRKTIFEKKLIQIKKNVH